MGAASSVSKRLNERSLSEPYSSRMRGGWLKSPSGASLSIVGISSWAAGIFGNSGKSGELDGSDMARHPLAIGIHHRFAILLAERALLRLGQNFQYQLRWTAQAHTERR